MQRLRLTDCQALGSRRDASARSATRAARESHPRDESRDKKKLKPPQAEPSSSQSLFVMHFSRLVPLLRNSRVDSGVELERDFSLTVTGPVRSLRVRLAALVHFSRCEVFSSASSFIRRSPTGPQIIRKPRASDESSKAASFP